MSEAKRNECTSPPTCSAPVYPERITNLYDLGYWDRYEGKPRPTLRPTETAGWDDCDLELRAEQNNNLTDTTKNGGSGNE